MTFFTMPRTAIVGIGNLMKADDGAGMVMAAILKERLADFSEVRTYETGTTPENHLAEIVAFKPEIIYLIDAADFEGEAGDFKLFPADEVKSQGFSTHAVSISLLIQFLKVQTKAEIFLLAIQPEEISTREGLSARVKSGMDEAIIFLEKKCR
jgi:hydrogenase 3 maturation protease